LFKTRPGNVLKATKPCAVAYGYARIRRLVRLLAGLYCFPVADTSAIGFSSSETSRCISIATDQSTVSSVGLRYGGYAWGTSVRRVP
jgi:hypothetical protein